MSIPLADKYDAQAFTVGALVGTSADVAPADPERVCLVLSAGAGGGSLDYTVTVVGGTGITYHVVNGSPQELLWSREGPLCQGKVTVAAQGAPTAAVVYALAFRG